MFDGGSEVIGGALVGGVFCCTVVGLEVVTFEFVVVEIDPGIFVEGEFWSCFPHPAPPEGTRETAASLPVCSDFREGRLAGGRRAVGTLPKLCMPCLRGSVFFCC